MRVPALCPDYVGGGPGQSLVLRSTPLALNPANSQSQSHHHLAATAELTSMLSPVTLPVTVAFFPAN